MVSICDILSLVMPMHNIVGRKVSGAAAAANGSSSLSTSSSYEVMPKHPFLFSLLYLWNLNIK